MASQAEPRFDEMLRKLEAVVARLESGDLGLEDSLAAFEEGVQLSRDAQRRLDAAERRVEELLRSSDDEGSPPRTAPLDVLDDEPAAPGGGAPRRTRGAADPGPPGSKSR